MYVPSLVAVAVCLATPPEIVVPVPAGAAVRGAATVRDAPATALRPGERVAVTLALGAGAGEVRGVRGVGGVEPGQPLRLRLAGAAALAPFPALVRQGWIPLPDGGGGRRTAFVGGARRDGGDVVADVPAPGPDGDRYALVDLSRSIEWVGSRELRADALDTAPLGSRHMLVLVHGKTNQDVGGTEHHVSKIDLWKPLRTSPDYARLRQRYKPYMYLYPTYRACRDNGVELARLIRAATGPDTKVAMVSHSMGAQVMRYAAAAAELSGRTAVLVSMAGAHRGSILASLMFANDHVIDRIGPFWWAVLKFGQWTEPDTPGLRSTAWDNHDGSVGADEAERYALVLNPDLARFNATDPNVSRLACLHGDVHSLAGKGPFWGIPWEVVRRGAAAFHPVFGNADPLIPLASGLLEGAAPHESMTWPNFDHTDIVTRPEVWAEVVARLEGVCPR
jgi:hypothetical protein